jgi:hypothetical protein
VEKNIFQWGIWSPVEKGCQLAVVFAGGEGHLKLDKRSLASMNCALWQIILRRAMSADCWMTTGMA